MGRYDSFVIRVWTDEHGRARGSIQHLRSADRLAFVSPEAVVGFIQAHLPGFAVTRAEKASLEGGSTSEDARP